MGETMKIFAVLLLASPVFACPKGSVEYNGACYVDPAPKDTVAVPEVKPSAERPPDDKMPSYQRSDVHVDDAKMAENSTTTAHDYQSERNQK
jgi:hypothetical protein